MTPRENHREVIEGHSVLHECVPSCDAVWWSRFAARQWATGKCESAIDSVGEAARARCAGSSGDCVVRATLYRALLLSYAGRVAEAESVLGSIRERGRVEFRVASHLVQAHLAATTGLADQAAALATRAVKDAGRIGMRAWTPVGHTVLAMVAIRGGDLLDASRHARSLEEAAVFGRGMYSAGQSAWVIVQIIAAKHGAKRAVPLVAELLASHAVTKDLFLSQPTAAAGLVRLAIDRGEHALAESAATTSGLLAMVNPGMPLLRAATLHAEGLHLADPELLRHAERTHTDPWAKASVLEDVGVLLSRRPDRACEAVASLEQALEAYFRLSAHRDFARVKSRLRDLGRTFDPRGTGHPRSNVSRLTDTEYAVARLVAQGCTNAQAADQLYLSKHTVAFHLKKIYRKLAVESRVQLAGLWVVIDEDDRVDGVRRHRDGEGLARSGGG